MGSSGYSSEIEISEEYPNGALVSGSSALHGKATERNGKSIDLLGDDLSQLIKAIDRRLSSRILDPTCQAGASLLDNNGCKRSPKTGTSHCIGITESASIKQALRRLCISQASEIAATKRLSMSTNSSGSEAGAIKRLYASLMVQDGEVIPRNNEERLNLTETSVSLVTTAASSFKRDSEACNVVPKFRVQDVINDTTEDTSSCHNIVEHKGKAVSGTCVCNCQTGAILSKPIVSSRLIKPVFRNKARIKKKVKPERNSQSSFGGCASHGASLSGFVEHSCHGFCGTSPVDFVDDEDDNIDAETMDNDAKNFDHSTSKEKGECSQSSKSSIGDYSTTTSISEESHSCLTGNGSKPHMSKDVRWISIRRTVVQQRTLGLDNFKLLKRLGCGDIGTVYLAELIDSDCLFALKVMDIEYLASRKKMIRAQTEKEILQMLDHPFLPTLYAHFTTDNLTCLVMEYCPGGDLHVLRQKQPGRRFSEPTARFYVAEVLLALEYLHMLGVIYRDLKPENILVREDGHIMLSDFDLSLRCSVNPILIRPSSFGVESIGRTMSGPCVEKKCVGPFCAQPSCVQPSCFTPRLSSSTAQRPPRPKIDRANRARRLPVLVVEPTDARSNSFVGTHEYLAPEIIRGDGHGSSVDWWTLGIFLYELLYAKTPFKGPGNDETLANVVSQSLRFPEHPLVSSHAKDLIRGLLAKEPENRFGSVRGAAEIKQHPFFEGLNWALIRCTAPPESHDAVLLAPSEKRKEGHCMGFRSTGDEASEFAVF